MKYIINDFCHNPYFNLALEEYLLKNSTEDILVLWQNEKTVVVGRNQNIMSEVDVENAKFHGIKIARRDTGGGTVYHDLGNLNFSVILNWKEDKEYNYGVFLKPVIYVLKNYGLPAQIQGRNDLIIYKKKISGNAATMYKNRLLHHGTLLWNSNLSIMPSILTVSKTKLKSKGVKSVKSRVGNIYSFLSKKKRYKITLEKFKKDIVESFCGNKAEEYILSENDLKNIKKIQIEKYETWDFIYGKSPTADLVKVCKYKIGMISVNLNLRHGKIRKCEFRGDFLSKRNPNEIASKLEGVRYERESIKNKLIEIEINKYLDIEIEDFLDNFF